MNIITQLHRLIIPACTVAILSSCLVLAWRLYQMAYIPLFSETTTVMTADDYTIPQAKLDNILGQIERKTSTTIDVTTLRNSFVGETSGE